MAKTSRVSFPEFRWLCVALYLLHKKCIRTWIIIYAIKFHSWWVFKKFLKSIEDATWYPTSSLLGFDWSLCIYDSLCKMEFPLYFVTFITNLNIIVPVFRFIKIHWQNCGFLFLRLKQINNPVPFNWNLRSPQPHTKTWSTIICFLFIPKTKRRNKTFELFRHMSMFQGISISIFCCKSSGKWIHTSKTIKPY